LKKTGIVAFAFGTPWTLKSNVKIGQIAGQKANEFNAEVYTQADIHIHPEYEAVVEYTHEHWDHQPPTLRIARGAVQWAKSKEIRRILVVAAGPHLWRAVRDLKMAVREAHEKIEVHGCRRTINRYPDDIWFCPDSRQNWTRSQKEWDRRERIMMLMPFSIYRLVAK